MPVLKQAVLFYLYVASGYSSYTESGVLILPCAKIAAIVPGSRGSVCPLELDLDSK